MSPCPPGHTRTRPGAPREVAHPRRGERGATWLSLLLLALLAGAGYLAWVWLPVYFVHYEVKQVARDYMNQAVKNPDDAELVANMTRKLAILDSVVGVDERGGRVVTPAVVVEPQDVTWERDTSGSPPMLRVSFVYERQVFYPLLDRTVTKVFTVALEGDLKLPDWGPPR